MRKQFKKCNKIVYTIDIIDAIVHDTVYYSYTHSLLAEFKDRVTVEDMDSIMRVVETCKQARTMKLIDYVPALSSVLSKLEHEDDEELAVMMKKIRDMTFIEFLDEAKSIVEKFHEKHNYFVPREIVKTVDEENMLALTLEQELSKLEKPVLEDED